MLLDVRRGRPRATSARCPSSIASTYAGGTSSRVDAGASLDELGVEPEDAAGPAPEITTSSPLEGRRSRCWCRTTGSWRAAPPITAMSSSTNTSDPPREAGAGRRASRSLDARSRRRSVRAGSDACSSLSSSAVTAGIAVVNPARSSSSRLEAARVDRRWLAGERRRCGAGDAAVVDHVDDDDGDVVAAAALVGQAHQLGRGLVGSSSRRSTLAIWSSPTSLNRPSLQSRKRSPVTGSTGQRSTSTVSYMPSARVTMLRCGWTSASSAVIRPSRTRSATRLWSSVSCASSPSRKR